MENDRIDGDEFRAARVKMGLKPKHMAEILHVSIAFISNMETQKAKVPLRISLVIQEMLAGWRPDDWKMK